MTGPEYVLQVVKLLLIGSLLAGVVVRRAYQGCYVFPLYLLAVAGTDLPLLWDPTLFTWNYWLAGECLHAALKFALAAELAWRLFAALPGARSTVATGLLLVSLVTLLVTLIEMTAAMRAPTGAEAHVVAQTALGRVMHGVAWFFGAVQGAKLYYRVPSQPLHTAILRGLVPFLMTFTVAIGLLETFGWSVRSQAGHGYALAYQVLLLYWIVVVWRRQEGPKVPPKVLRTLQPWR